MASAKKTAARKRRRRRTPEEIITDLETRIEKIRRRQQRRARRKAAAPKPKGPRFSPQWLASHREKLAISAADYGALVGVSALTIYNWEKGRNKPQARQREALAAIRGLRKREAWRRLEEMGL